MTKSDINQVYILADSNEEIGTGHIMRTFILAQKLVGLNIEVIYLLSQTSEKIMTWLSNQSQKFKILPLEIRNNSETLIKFLATNKKGKQFLLFDSDEKAFHNIQYQKQLRKNGIGLGLITMQNHPFNLDILHNQNPLSKEYQYSLNLDSKKLLGLDYLIVKDQFISIHRIAKEKSIKRINTLLLSFGGADKNSLTIRIVNILNQLSREYVFNVYVVVGALNEDYNKLINATTNTRHNYTLYRNTPEMPRLIMESDLCINSGGLVTWETAICNTINFVIPTSERELLTSNYLKNKNLIYQNGNHTIISDIAIEETLIQICHASNDWNEMTSRFYQMVNPQGADLFIQEIKKWLQYEL